MIATKTKTNNSYGIDKSSKYISLIHPLFEKYVNKNEITEEDEKERTDSQYYVRKYEYFKSKGLINDRSLFSVEGRINGNSVRKQLVNVPQIVFEVTDACNLKCEYCSFGDLYGDYDPRRNRMMKYEDIIPFLQFITDLWQKNSSLSFNKVTTISFYGGEPLLNIKLIEKIVDIGHSPVVFGRPKVFFCFRFLSKPCCAIFRRECIAR
jgi:uncharacterized protein